MGDFDHIPVMPQEVDELLALKSGAIYVDGTLGLGGHALVAAGRIGAAGRIVGIDQDSQAIAIAQERLKGFAGRLDIVKSNFSHLEKVLKDLGIDQIDGCLFDLGVSSLQFDDPKRGFSFRFDGPLDMRMDAQAQLSALEIVNSFSEEDLADVIWRYGEERFSRRIARGIVRARSIAGLNTTTDLVDVISKALPYKTPRDGVHPATRTFQALRIAVNRELDVLSGVLGVAFAHLKPGGRMGVISFHSLEDRIVKDQFRQWAKEGQGRLLTKKPLRPQDSEVAQNPRSRSAKLRVIERIV